MKIHDITTCDKNHGVKTDRSLEDFYGVWKVGATSKIPFFVQNSSGNWKEFTPPGEWQRDTDTDTFACVSYEKNNNAETQLNKFLYEGKLSDWKIKGCIALKYLKSKTGMVINLDAVKNNPRNFSFDMSDRALAMMSDTKPDGNYLWKVAEVMRTIGIVGEARWPSPQNYTWGSYYSPVPQEIQMECGEFLKLFDVAYDFFDVTRDNLRKFLLQAPVSIVLPGHNVMDIYSHQNIEDYFDSYEPFYKQLVGLPMVAMRLLITIKPDDMPAELLRVFRIEGKQEVFAILNGRRYWVSPYSTYQDGRGRLWADVNAADTAVIKQSEADKYPIAGLFGNASILDYVRFLFIK